MKVDFEVFQQNQFTLLIYGHNHLYFSKKKKKYYKVSAYQLSKNFFTLCFYSITFCF